MLSCNDHGPRLFISYGGVHARILGPIIQECERRRPASTVVLGLTSAASIFAKDFGIRCIQAKNFSSNFSEPVPTIANAVLEDMRTTGQRIWDEEESHAYLQFGIQGFLEQEPIHEEDAIRRICLDRRHLWPIELVRRVFTKYQPSLLVTSNCPRTEQAAQMHAHRLGIPSAIIPDLFCEHERYPLQANLIFVINEKARKNLHRLYRVPLAHILVTGNPCYEQSLRTTMTSAIRRQSLTRLSWFDQNGYYDKNQQSYRYRTGEEIRATLLQLVRVCRHIGLTLVARPHPSQNLERFKRICRSVCSDIIVDDSPNFIARIEESRICASIASTVLLHALTLGCPVVQLIGGSNPFLDLQAIQGAYRVGGTSDEELQDVLQTILNDSRISGRCFLDPLGCQGATTRIVDALDELERTSIQRDDLQIEQ